MASPTWASLAASHSKQARREPRTRVAIDATLETVAGVATAFIINLSRREAMVQTPDLPSEGDFLLLKCGKLEATGTLAWSGRSGAG